ncbi:bifunctional oligoribonuclease/PAP phosphatase NrnA [Ascidiimonas aurantiaca]|uniref:DHH family phosphoesterase n=1 Tax=Ascidiimonas aurantiaca TaxID=1685432 RepID=UPI0030EB684A
MKMNDSDILKKELETPRKIVIVPHRNPDGDAVGSSLALWHFFTNSGHKATVVSPNDYPDFLKWVPGEETIVKFDSNKQKATELLTEAHYIFTVDFNSFSRIEEMKPVLENCDATFVMIDHHQQPDSYAKFMYSDTSMSSTCEMVFNFLEEWGALPLIEENIATCLYMGIMTDTGSFRFPSTTSTTHRVIATLIDKGARNAYIHNQVYDTNSVNKLQLLGCALSNLIFLENYRTVFITLSSRELEQHQFKKGDTEGFVNYGLSLKNIVFSVIFIENAEEGYIKISLRSKGSFDVNEFARKHFNGGGHVNAAGGRSDLPIKQTTDYFKSILPEYVTKLHNS